MSKNKTSVCFICKSKEDDELLYGKFYEKWRLRVHYYCLLLTSNLVQNGESDEEGIFGFLREDISTEEARIASQKCYVCKNKYANISCCAKKCFRTFHTVCGRKNGCLSHFIDTYQSWCDKHVELIDKEHHEETDSCGICYDNMGPYDKLESIYAPCCHNGWFHRRCVAQFAQTAGYFFKCPLCNNKDDFTHAVQLRGVFVPEKDAAWELEPNAFNEQLERPSVCDAEICRCRYGRKYDNINKWDLILCATCGSTCRHDLCMEVPSKNYVCTFCQPIVGNEPPPAVLALAEAARRAEAEKQAAANRCLQDVSSDDSEDYNSPGSSNSATNTGRRRGRAKHRSRRQPKDSSSSDESDKLNNTSNNRKKRRISSSDTSSASSVVTNKKRKSRQKRDLSVSSYSSRSSSGSGRLSLQEMIRDIKLPVDSAKKLLISKPVVKIKKLSDQQIKGMTSSENEDTSSTTSLLFDFNYRVKLNKKQRRKSISDLRSIKEVIRSDTDTLTDTSGAKESKQNKTPSNKGFAKQFKLKLFVSKTTSRKRLGSTSESEYEVPLKKSYFSPDKSQSRSRVSLFALNNEENTCPNSPVKVTVEPVTAIEKLPSPVKLLDPSPTIGLGSGNRKSTVSNDEVIKLAPQQRTLNSFFIKSTSNDDVFGQHPASTSSAITSTNAGAGSGNKNAKRSATKTPSKGRKKIIEMDRGQRNLLDYFNRC